MAVEIRHGHLKNIVMVGSKGWLFLQGKKVRDSDGSPSGEIDMGYSLAARKKRNGSGDPGMAQSKTLTPPGPQTVARMEAAPQADNDAA